MKSKNLLAGAALLAAAACQPASDAQNQQTANAQATATPAMSEVARQAREETGELRFVVDKSDRQVRIFRGQQLVRAHPVAVGSSEYPTPTGAWTFTRVDINPEWNPPDSEWAEGEETQPPGAPGNPMGRARLVYNMPYTIHGTDDLQSLGNKESHGSIRVANPVVLELAEMLLRAGGSWEGPQWFRQRVTSTGQEFQITLAEPVPIEVVE